MTIRLAGLIPALALLAASGAHAQGTPPSAPDAPAEVSGAAATRHPMHMRHHAMPAAASPAPAASAGDGATPAGKAAAQALATTPSDTPVPYVDFSPMAASSSKGMMHHAMMHHAMMHGHMAAKKAPTTQAQ